MSQDASLPGTWCCGVDRSSNFCPECGRQLGCGPLVDLLAHCHTILRRQRRLLDQQTNLLTQKPTKRGQAKRDQYARAVATWKARCQALTAAIDRERAAQV